MFGGLPPKTGPLSEGYFAIPTVFADRSNDWRLAREEIFGPVLVAIRWSDEAEAIRMANDSHYGLAAYVWTHDIGKGLRAAHAIESGWVQVNQGGGQTPGMSYGGYKQSGIGREFSLEGMLDSFTQTQERDGEPGSLDDRIPRCARDDSFLNRCARAHAIREQDLSLHRHFPMEVGRALIGVADAVEQGFVERAADQLQADRRRRSLSKPQGTESAGNAERVERPGEAGEAAPPSSASPGRPSASVSVSSMVGSGNGMAGSSTASTPSIDVARNSATKWARRRSASMYCVAGMKKPASMRVRTWLA